MQQYSCLSAVFEATEHFFVLKTVLSLDLCEKTLSLFSFSSAPWQAPLPLPICQGWILASASFYYMVHSP